MTYFPNAYEELTISEIKKLELEASLLIKPIEDRFLKKIKEKGLHLESVIEFIAVLLKYAKKQVKTRDIFPKLFNNLALNYAIIELLKEVKIVIQKVRGVYELNQTILNALDKTFQQELKTLLKT